MTAKEYLRQVKVLDVKIKSRRRQVEDLKDLATSTGSILPKDKVQSSPAADRMADAVAEWVDMQAEIIDLIREMEKTRNRIIGEIHQLNDEKYIRILELKYIQGIKNWEVIADMMGYSVKQTHRIHGYALQEFTRKIMMS